MKSLSDYTIQSAADYDFGTIAAILFGIVVAIIALPLLIVGVLIMNASRSNEADHPRSDEKTLAEIDAATYEESGMIHQHYEMSGTIVQGLKDPEW